jgi:SAM-dependent methyltransferase
MLSSMTTTHHGPGAQSGRSLPTHPATAEGAPREASGTMAHQRAQFDWAAQLTRLELGEELHRPFFEQASAWLRELRRPVRTGRILDVGSGAGVVTAVLAHAFPDAQVVAVDGTPGLLDAVRARAERADIADRVQVLHASLPEDAAKLPDADLIWASDALHHIGDQQAAIELLRGHLRRGGLLAVCEGGLPARFLPNEIGFGRPGLQSRLDAATADGFAAMRAALPNATPAVDDWPDMLRASGFEAVASRTFLVDVPAPLSASGRAYLRTNLAAQRDGLAERLDATDLEAIARLLDDDDPGGLSRRPDVFFLTARTVHTGRVGSAT